MRPLSAAPIRRALTAALSATACTVALAAAPAGADPGSPAPDPGNTVVVSRLSVSDGHGWLTLHARNSTATGYDVRIPAGNGSWSGRADVYLSEQDAHCLLQPGPDLHYVCRPSAQPSPEDDLLPAGSYAVSIPVTRTGSVDGLTGSARSLAESADTYVDTFPVLDGSHYRSTAEVRAAPVTREAGEAEGRANLAVTTTIVPREAITALDVSLPAGAWRIIGSNVANHGVRCSLAGVGTGSPSVHCRAGAADASGLPAGRYNLVLILGFDGDPQEQYSQVSLTESALAPDVEDTFPWVTG
jgi:hypothetical protein